MLPPEEFTIVRPPLGDPSAKPNEFWLLKKTLYGLCHSPRHWYDKIDKILRSMGLTPNPYDPCVYAGYINDSSDGLENALPITLMLGL